MIDAQLREAGWECDTTPLSYAKGTRPEANCNKAIAEWPYKGGYADYMLFLGLTPIAAVEAKRGRRKERTRTPARPKTFRNSAHRIT